MKKACKVINIIICFIAAVQFFCTAVFASWPYETDFTGSVNTYSTAVFMAEVESGKVLFDQNSHMRVYPASTIKVLTALIAVENASLDDILTVSWRSTQLPEGYTVLPLYAGERITLRECMYGMLVKSANDCAKAIAEHVGGSIEGFAAMMNEKAKELGCQDSHFTNPYGGFDYDHYSTAYDMYLITKAAFANTVVRKIAHTHDCYLDETNLSYERYIVSGNHLLDPDSYYYNPDVIASKTGNLDTGRCIVALSEHGDAQIITVCMHSPAYLGVFDDVNELLGYAKEHVDLERIARNAHFPGLLEAAGTFTDVADSSASYYKPIYWAVREKIIVGYKDATFRPDKMCTRGQFVTMLWRMAGKPDADGASRFTDVNQQMSSFAAVNWAASQGIIKGYKDGSFRPEEPLSRSQIVVILWRALGRPAASEEPAFTDLSRDSSAYRAIAWAAQEGVIVGYADGAFGVSDSCSRSQLVTILYRAARAGLIY